MEFQKRFLPIPEQSFFLFGPRGTGKSTWLRHLFPEALFVDLLQPDVYREMSARPERLRELVLGSPQRQTVVVDEVQRVPFDAGVYRSLPPRGPLDRAEEIDGGAFEGLVAQHLRAWIAYT